MLCEELKKVNERGELNEVIKKNFVWVCWWKESIVKKWNCMYVM